MKYSKETDAMIKKVRKAIEMTAGGSVPQEYEPQLVLLADNFENYIMCRDAIKKEGIVVHTRTGEVKTDALYTAMLNTQTVIQRTMPQFGLTVLSKSKIKVQETVSEADSPIVNFLA